MEEEGEDGSKQSSQRPVEEYDEEDLDGDHNNPVT